MANEILGSDAKVFINSTVYDVVEGSIQENRSLARADTTGTGRYEVQVVDKQALTFRIKALRYTSLNPHATPLFIAKSGTAGGSDDKSAVKVFRHLDDIGDDTKAWRFDVVWDNYSEDFRAESGLLTLSASGKSTASYKRPGDS